MTNQNQTKMDGPKEDSETVANYVYKINDMRAANFQFTIIQWSYFAVEI